MRSEPMRGVVFGLLFSGLIWCAGCATWMKTYVALHDAADAALTNKPLPFVADSSTVTPTNKPDAWVIPAENAIPAFTGKYSQGSKATEYGEEIWIANWNRLNIRIHANPGEFRGEGVPSVGPWYPILASGIPDGTVTMQKTATGCTLTAKDFVSRGGQAYRFEGWRCDGIGQSMQRVYTVTLTASQMRGACFAWYATVEK